MTPALPMVGLIIAAVIAGVGGVLAWAKEASEKRSNQDQGQTRTEQETTTRKGLADNEEVNLSAPTPASPHPVADPSEQPHSLRLRFMEALRLAISQVSQADTGALIPFVHSTSEPGIVMLWLKAEGELVEVGEPLVRLSMGSSETDITAPVDGILGLIEAGVGDSVAFGEEMAIILAAPPTYTAGQAYQMGRSAYQVGRDDAAARDPRLEQERGTES